jgi:hypothetical protein
MVKAVTKNKMKPDRWGDINLVGLGWTDEMGMCTLNLLALLSQVAGKARVDDGRADVTVPFGDLNVIMMGDFHQFLPVGASNAALYCPPVARNTATVRKAIYLQFETVIDLAQQWQITDEEWMNILARLRDGECTKQDIHKIHKLIITNPECDIPDFDSEPWNTATLVTPRNCVWTTWNRLALQKHCKSTGNILYICNTEDTIGNDRQPTNYEQKVIITRMNLAQTRKVTQRIKFVIGMQVVDTLAVG